MIKMAVIADDLTGANDTAVQFAKHNISTCVRMDFENMEFHKEKSDVVVIDTDSRDMTPNDAYEKVKRTCELIKAQHVQHIYKKIDSTLRGNLGAEIAAAADVFEPDIIVIAPAFPSNHRVTIGGCQFLNGVPINKTEIAYAPKTSVKESNIVKLLNTQTDAEIVSIPLTSMDADADIVRGEVEHCLSLDKKWIVFDVVKEMDFKTILSAVKGYEKILWVGSAGLAEQLSVSYKCSTGKQMEKTAKEGDVLIVAGSLSKITRGQIQELLENSNVQLVKINVISIIDEQEFEIKQCIEEVNRHLESKKDVLLTSVESDDDVEKVVQKAKIYGLSGKEVSERTACAFAEVVRNVFTDGLAGLVLTGGDIAAHVCRGIKAEGIEVIEEISMGVPLGRLIGGKCDGLNVVTKAGAFGKQNLFLQVLDVLHKR